MKKYRSEEKEFIVYRASDWRLYHFNDPEAEIIKTGLTYWEASRLCDKLNKEDLKFSGRYRLCHQDDWNQQFKFV